MEREVTQDDLNEIEEICYNDGYEIDDIQDAMTVLADELVKEMSHDYEPDILKGVKFIEYQIKFKQENNEYDIDKPVEPIDTGMPEDCSFYEAKKFLNSKGYILVENKNDFLLESKQDDAIEIFAKIYGVSVNSAWDMMGDLQHDIDLDRLFNSSMSAKEIAFKILDQYEYGEEVEKRLEEYKRTGTITVPKKPKHKFGLFEITVINSKNEKRDYTMKLNKSCTTNEYIKYGMQVFVDNVKNQEYTKYGISSIDDIKEIKFYRLQYGFSGLMTGSFKPNILNYMIDKGYVKV